MKRSIITKLMIDLAMIFLFAFLLAPALTGMAFHEIFGLGMGIVVIGHLLMNRKWIASIFHSKKSNARKDVLIILNVLMSADFVMMILTGVLISTTLFPNINIGNRELLVLIHTVSAWSTGALMLIHLLLHAKYLSAVFSKLKQSGNRKSFFKGLGITAALVLVCGIFYANALPAIEGASQSVASQNAVSQEATTLPETTTPTPEAVPAIVPETKEEDVITQQDNTTENDTVISPTPEAGDDPSLEEFLAGLRCTACGKNCLLTNPRCGRGEAQYEEKVQEYNNTYNV